MTQPQDISALKVSYADPNVLSNTTEQKPTWKTTFNSNLKWYGWIDKAVNAAKSANYPFVLWNGKVFDVNTDNFSCETAVCLEPEL